jgi:hypothetical protein
MIINGVGAIAANRRSYRRRHELRTALIVLLAIPILWRFAQIGRHYRRVACNCRYARGLTNWSTPPGDNARTVIMPVEG